jgi:peroxiredoxin (alkyl hydroperoxide reductase subunit C)
MYGVNEPFPEFELEACMPDKSLGTVNSTSENIEKVLDNKWKVYYFYPKDFTFICPTEIKDFDKLVDVENVEVFGFSGDNEFCKLNWRENNDLIKDIRHPLIADTGLTLSKELGIADEENGVCLRATYICDEANNIQHVSVNALDTGRNVDEVIRTLEALRAGGLTGCSWTPGDKFVG